MALDRIAIPPDARRDEKARALVAQVRTWHTVTLRQDWGAFKAGDQARQTPNGYRVNAVWCECPDYAQWGHICKHVRAIVLAERQTQTRRYEDLVPTCKASGCDNDPELREDFCSRHVLVDAF